MPRKSIHTAVLLFAAAIAALHASPAHAVQRGWSKVELPSVDTYSLNYVPQTLDLTQPAPLVVFLHGFGAGPEPWQLNTNIGQIAEELGFVLVMPRAAQDFNFGTGADDLVIDTAIAAAEQELLVDRRRIGLAGFSAGAAYALVLAETTPNAFTGVFAMGAPYRPVVRLQDPASPPPARLLYGTLDPNYPIASTEWQKMLDRLGVPNEFEIVSGLRHEVPSDESLRTGFRFLLDQPLPTCVPTPTALCLRDRFRVEATWETASAQGAAGAVPLTHESGYLWFFAAGNVEVDVKLLDGCALNQRYWVFAAGTTDVGVTLTVTDTLRGGSKSYTHARGTPFTPVLDTGAFATCP
ncbi:MAG TPA: alpha/beta fold hydrolase [Thermoanaerobaculia bacterium]|nr:alpha/beta fold hydrolase [Thermoanaerobaculia bacterium]HXT52435.1 alpha/beta fold hydrolase [Thermoanaerobaculia bacterium]